MKDHLSKLTGWSKTGILITQENPDPLNPSHFQTLQCDFESNSERMGAGGYTIQFGIVPPTQSSPAQGVAFARAEVTWSIAGNNVTRIVDIINGRLVSGTGQAIKVRMSDCTPTGLVGPGTSYGIFCQLTKGTRPSQNQPPTLQVNYLPFTITPGGFNPVPIIVPQDAGVISLETCGVDTTTAAEAILQCEFSCNAQPIKTFVSPGPGRFVPLPAGANGLQIRNNGTNPALVFATWGIDG